MKRATFWQRLWNHPLTVGGTVLLVLGAGTALFSSHGLILEMRFFTRGFKAQGVVTRKQSESYRIRGRGARTAYRYYVQYTVETPQGRLNAREEVDSLTYIGATEGGTVPVAYLRELGMARIVGNDMRPWLASPLTAVLAALLITAGGWLLGIAASRTWTIARLAGSGMETVGTVSYVQRIEPSQHEDFVWYIHFAFTDHQGVVRYAHSDSVTCEEAQSWKPGDKGLVRYDEKRPQISLWIGRP